MVPVQLHLRNFLSYGESAPVLEFDRFHVACLSGRNGQGKSALLDAITWALWGEARKGSGSRKPDDDLLRIGSQAMRVVLVFDIEGERYRITRGYRKSATGKTSRPELEFQIFEASEDQYKPITGANVSKTQKQIDRVLGVDYETFINSAFLLQGRSDEFTRKNPSERKAILGRVLDLGKYEQLASRARDRRRELDARLNGLSAEVDRLQEALRSESDVLRERDRLQATLSEMEDVVLRQEARENELRGTWASFEIFEARAADAQSRRERLTERFAQIKEDYDSVAVQLERARGIIKKADHIRGTAAKKAGLEVELEQVQEKQALFDGMTRQLTTLESRRDKLRFELEKQVHRLESEQRTDRSREKELQTLIERGEEIRKKWVEADAAVREASKMEPVAVRYASLVEQLRREESRIQTERARIESRIEGLDEDIEQRRAALERERTLHGRIELLERERVRLEKLRENRRLVLEQGKSAGAELKAEETRHTEWLERRGSVESEIERLDSLSLETCPTCGTRLTEEHRRQVASNFSDERKQIQAKISGLATHIEHLREERDKLRAQYRAFEGADEKYEAVRSELLELKNALASREQKQGELQHRLELRAVLSEQLREESFAGELHRSREQTRSTIEQIDFNAEHFEALRMSAATFPHARAALDRLEQAEEKLVLLRNAIERRVRDLEEARLRLDEQLAPIQEHILETTRSRQHIGFQPDRLALLRRDIAALGDTSREVFELEQAEASIEGLSDRQQTIQTDRDGVERALEETRTTLEEARKALVGRERIGVELQDVVKRKESLQGELRAARLRLGEVSERLRQCAVFRDQIRESNKQLKDVRKKKSLYGHLSNAFNKNGIPSLIIEETLPEIEERTNDLLYRLTDGKTQVRLETLRDKKSGKGTKETLELKITDELGVARPYETYSGGEGFRVNFALRIALAQLLAERSGVRIQTLVIDEGFGTQDREGIANLVEAIQKVSSDFAKILVITHLQELKEAFDVRIEVRKDPAEGSTFQIVGAA